MIIVLRVSEIAGFIGVGLAGAAYVPQVWHLVRVHCAAGISRFAFSLWLGATLLVTTNAIATGAPVFIVLGGVQIIATVLVLIYATKYRSTYCDGHVPIDPGEVRIRPVITGSTEGPGGSSQGCRRSDRNRVAGARLDDLQRGGRDVGVHERSEEPGGRRGRDGGL